MLKRVGRARGVSRRMLKRTGREREVGECWCSRMKQEPEGALDTFKYSSDTRLACEAVVISTVIDGLKTPPSPSPLMQAC